MSTNRHLLAARATLQVREFKPPDHSSHTKVYPGRNHHVKGAKRNRWPNIFSMLGLMPRKQSVDTGEG